MEKLYTVTDVCKIFSVKPVTVRRWISQGRLAAVKIGKSYRVKEEALQLLGLGNRETRE